MKPTKILLVLLTFSIIHSQFSIATAQPGNSKRAWHWYFGNGAGLDFSSGQAVADTNGAMMASEGCATISDSLGNLLFYTNGEIIWNKNHQIMDNGNGLFGCESASQSSIIIPKPNDNNIYYVFTVDVDCSLKGLSYSIVDMSLNSGLGVVTQKNIHLLDTIFEKITAVYHKNEKDIWVMVNKGYLNKYYAYLITENGITTSPVISSFTDSIKILHNDSIEQAYFGYMKFSPDGSKLANAISYVLDTTTWIDEYISFINVFDFNNETGILTNKIVLSADSLIYGISFSPNSKLLYYASKYSCSTIISLVKQYSIVGSYNDIINSNTLIATKNTSYTLSASLQITPLSTILCSPNATNLLSEITKPNIEDTMCNYIEGNIYLYRQLGWGLPNFIESYFLPDTQTNITQNINKTIKVYPNPTNNYLIVENLQNINLKIINIYGQQIENLDLQATTSYIDVSAYENGIYFLVFTNQKQIISKKIVITH